MRWATTGAKVVLAAVLVAGAAASCVTRSGFERDQAKLRCELHDVCKRRQCDDLKASADPNDRKLYGLTCPPSPKSCGHPSYGDWAPDEPPGADCSDFHSDQARQCLAELQALLQVSETTPLTSDSFCWGRPPSCQEVYTEIEWPDCPLEK
jgi:hypothetical protein